MDSHTRRTFKDTAGQNGLTLESTGRAEIGIFSTHGGANRDVGINLSASSNGQEYSLALDRANDSFVIAPSNVDTANTNKVFALDALGNITASGNISSSGTVSGLTGSFSHLVGTSPITVGDEVIFQSNISATDITGSSILIKTADFATGNALELQNGEGSSYLQLSHLGQLNIGGSTAATAGHITSSGNLLLNGGFISQSGGTAAGGLSSNTFTGNVNLDAASSLQIDLQPVASNNGSIMKIAGTHAVPIEIGRSSISKITFKGNITGSGVISGSSHIIAKSASFSHLAGNSPIEIGDEVIFQDGISQTITTGASQDLASDIEYTVNGHKVEVKAITAANITNDSSGTFKLLNSSIEANSVIFGAFIGNHSNTHMSGSVISVATLGAHTASVFIHNITGATIAADTPFTASFVVL